MAAGPPPLLCAEQIYLPLLRKNLELHRLDLALQLRHPPGLCGPRPHRWARSTTTAGPRVGANARDRVFYAPQASLTLQLQLQLGHALGVLLSRPFQISLELRHPTLAARDGHLQRLADDLPLGTAVGLNGL